MKIVHVVNHFIADFGYQEHFLARAMGQMGHEVHVVTSNRAYPNHGVYRALAESFPTRELPVGIERKSSYVVHRLPAVMEANLQLFMKGLPAEIRRIDPDLVIMHGFSRYETMRLAAIRLIWKPRWKLIVDDHSLFAFHEPRLYRRTYHALVRELYRWVLYRGIDRVVPVAAECREFLSEIFGLPTERMKVIPLGADCSLFRFSEQGRAKVREELGLGPNAVLIAYIGKVVEERGVRELVQIVAPILRARPTARLLILGQGIVGEYAGSVRRLASELNVTDQVIWRKTVPQSELPAWYSAVDVAVWPRQETIAALEASACRVPIVVSANPISKERIAGGNGVSCADPAAYAEAISQLTDDPQYRKRLGEAGEAFVRGRYDWPRLAEEFLSAIK